MFWRSHMQEVFSRIYQMSSKYGRHEFSSRFELNIEKAGCTSLTILWKKAWKWNDSTNHFWPHIFTTYFCWYNFDCILQLGQLDVINFYNITSKLRVGIDEKLVPY